MKFLSFSYQESCNLSYDELEQLSFKVQSEIEHLRTVYDAPGYESEFASIKVPSDQEMIAKVEATIAEKKALHPTMLIVIGIGGSNLGAKAVHEALFGTYYNAQDPDIKVYWADTVDSDYILDITLLFEQELQKGHAVILNVVSKSGKTVETIANFEIFLSLLKRYRPDDYRDYVVVITDEGSVLWQLAMHENFACLAIPRYVGGRYSVFSSVGLFSLGLLGVDIKALLDGARVSLSFCLDRDFFKNPAALSASMIYAHYQHDITIHDHFIFSVDLGALGMWYRQLMAESIGKRYDRKGREVRISLMPTVSIGSTDLHSMIQLYLGGACNRFTAFISLEKNKSQLMLPIFKEYEKCVAQIQGKPLSLIMHAILYGVQAAYKNDGLPFYTVIVPEKSAFWVGQFLQWKMIEIMYLGYLLNINPFDQPQVELYKKETRKILTNG